MKKGNVITISDVAEALGVSKTTVSRAISGKGRIGEATRQKVLAYIEEHDYKPNVIARGLAQSKTRRLNCFWRKRFRLLQPVVPHTVKSNRLTMTSRAPAAN